MNAVWAALAGGLPGVLIALAAWLNARAAHDRISSHLDNWHGPGMIRSPLPAPRPPAPPAAAP